MTTNTTRRTALPKKTPLPVESSLGSQTEAIPQELELFAHMKDLLPVQQMAMVIPAFAKALKTEDGERMKEALAGLLWGVGIDFGVPLPEWAKAASQRGWKAMGFEFVLQIANGDMAALGRIVEMVELLPKSDEPSPIAPRVEDSAFKFIKLLKDQAGHLPAADFVRFGDGRISASKAIAKAMNPTERAMAFIVIAAAWRESEKLGSRNKAYAWLKERKIISPSTEWSEVKDWLAEINFPKGKAGRPKRK